MFVLCLRCICVLWFCCELSLLCLCCVCILVVLFSIVSMLRLMCAHLCLFNACVVFVLWVGCVCVEFVLRVDCVCGVCFCLLALLA